MKQEISALDLHYLIQEFEPLLNSKIDQIYQYSKEDFLFQFHKTGTGKILLRIKPKSIYLASEKQKSPEKLMAFCEYLRKKLSQARIRSIRQLGFERILKIGLDSKDRSASDSDAKSSQPEPQEKKIKKYFLYIELFDKGNLILCNEKEKILFARVQHKWKDRVIRSKETYSYPKKEHNFLLLKEQDLRELLQKSSQSVVKVLATELGLGGVYAEEACIISKIDKNKTKLSDKEIKSLFDSIETLKSKKLDPVVIIREGQETEAFPFRLFSYNNLKQKPVESFSRAIEIVSDKKKTKPLKLKELEKTEKIIEKQQQTIENLEKKAEENKRKAELLYENYQVLEKIMNQLEELKERHDWDFIKKELKKYKMIKKINEKKGELVIDL